jgi:hypothetical protein
MAKRIDGIKGAFSAIGYFGAAIFCGFLAYAGKNDYTPSNALYAIACLLLLFGFWQAIWGRIFKAIIRGVSSNIIPSAVLVTEGDKRRFDEMTKKRTSALRTATLALGSMVVACSINLFSSWLFHLWISIPK